MTGCETRCALSLRRNASPFDRVSLPGCTHRTAAEGKDGRPVKSDGVVVVVAVVVVSDAIGVRACGGAAGARNRDSARVGG